MALLVITFVVAASSLVALRDRAGLLAATPKLILPHMPTPHFRRQSYPESSVSS